VFGVFNYVATLTVRKFAPCCYFQQGSAASGAITQIPIYHTVVPAWCNYFLQRRPG